MNGIRIFVLATLCFTAVSLIAQTSTAARQQAPARGVPSRGVTVYDTPDGRQDRRLAILESRLDEISRAVDQLKTQTAGARTPVQLNTESRSLPKRDAKTDDFGAIQRSINNIWTTIDAIKADIKLLNAQ